jgi:hypothetical protein
VFEYFFSIFKYMNSYELIASWKQEEQAPFTGWDFSHLDGRMLEDQPPWSYSSRAAQLMRQSSAMLDLGTGGGERLLKLQEHWPSKVVATEEYPPNFRLATQRLAPLGVMVVDVRLTEGDPMPFTDGEFDLVLDRHSAFNPREVSRLIAPGGTFFTQQVHGLWAQDLLAVFGTVPQWPDSSVAKYVPQLQAGGLEIVDTQDWSGHLAFTDVAAIVYYLKAVPWLVPGFSVATHLQPLLSLQHQLESGRPLTYIARKYLIEAYQPSA